MKNVLLYGADPTGSTDSTAAIQAAIDAAKVDGDGVFAPSGAYRVGSLDLTGVPDFPGGLTLAGDGAGRTRIYGSEQTWPGPILDCTNSNRLRLEGFTLLGMDLAGAPPAVVPSCGFLFAQAAAGGSNRNRATFVEAFGFFGVACCAIIGGSNSELVFFSFQQWNGSAYALYVSGNNAHGVTSPFLSVVPCPSVNEWNLRGELHAWGAGFTSGSAPTIWIEGHLGWVNHLRLRDCLIDCNTPGGSAIFSNGVANYVTLDGSKFYSEVGTPARYAWNNANGAAGNVVAPLLARGVDVQALTGDPVTGSRWLGVTPT